MNLLYCIYTARLKTKYGHRRLKLMYSEQPYPWHVGIEYKEKKYNKRAHKLRLVSDISRSYEGYKIHSQTRTFSVMRENFA